MAFRPQATLQSLRFRRCTAAIAPGGCPHYISHVRVDGWLGVNNEGVTRYRR
jgi:hypothetical protein